MVIDTIFVYHFVDPDLRLEIFFEKEGQQKMGGVDFEIEENCIQSLSTNLLLFGDKIAFKSARGRVFLYSWDRLGGVCRKLLSQVKLCQRLFRNMKYRSEFKHDFTNRGFLHCFKEKSVHKTRDMQFFLRNVQNEIFKILKIFKNNMKLTRAACWINSK